MCLKEIIREYGLTYDMLAERLGCTKVRVVQIANSKNLRTDTLQRWADAIGCKRGDFFRDEMTEIKGDPIEIDALTTCPRCQGNIRVKLKLLDN